MSADLEEVSVTGTRMQSNSSAGYAMDIWGLTHFVFLLLPVPIFSDGTNPTLAPGNDPFPTSLAQIMGLLVNRSCLFRSMLRN